MWSVYLILIALGWYFRIRLFLTGVTIYRYFYPITTQFRLTPNRQVAEISYVRIEHPYRVWVPYDRHLAGRSIGHTATLIRDNEEINITQQPGIPYLVTAEDLGGSEIRIQTRNAVFVYRGSDPIPTHIFESE